MLCRLLRHLPSYILVVALKIFSPCSKSSQEIGKVPVFPAFWILLHAAAQLPNKRNEVLTRYNAVYSTIQVHLRPSLYWQTLTATIVDDNPPPFRSCWSLL